MTNSTMNDIFFMNWLIAGKVDKKARQSSQSYISHSPWQNCEINIYIDAQIPLNHNQVMIGFKHDVSLHCEIRGIQGIPVQPSCL